MKLKKYKLSDVATFDISNVDKKCHDGESEVQLCNFTDVYYNWAVTKDLQPSFMVATASRNQIDKFTLRKGQVAITKDSETRYDIGIPCYIADDFDNVVLGYHCALITPNPEVLDGRYLNAFLNSKVAKEYFENNASGSGQRYALGIDAINDITLYLPSIQEQRLIGKLFADIDRKIATNRAINRNLEAMAKQLYDYWFVQFDFPDENGRPYKSSGGKMVWNEKLKREIPESWTLKQIQDVEKKIITGKTPSTSVSEYFGGDIPFVTIDDIRGNLFVFESARTLTEVGADSQASKYVLEGSLCCSCIGTVGVMGFAGKKFQTNQQINTIDFSDINNSEYLYFALQMYFTKATAKVGNILANMNKQEFASIPIVYPKYQVLCDYHNIVLSGFKTIRINTLEIINLTKQRDELLPLLMNGQVSVTRTAVNCDLWHD
jgi:type I restriction enzyme S subunit